MTTAMTTPDKVCKEFRCISTMQMWLMHECPHQRIYIAGPMTGLEHRLTKPKTPQTNGMVERFNGRLSQVLRSHHFNRTLLHKSLLFQR